MKSFSIVSRGKKLFLESVSLIPLQRKDLNHLIEVTIYRSGSFSEEPCKSPVIKCLPQRRCLRLKKRIYYSLRFELPWLLIYYRQWWLWSICLCQEMLLPCHGCDLIWSSGRLAFSFPRRLVAKVWVFRKFMITRHCLVEWFPWCTKQWGKDPFVGGGVEFFFCIGLTECSLCFFCPSFW